MALIQFRDVSIRFVGPPLLEGVNLTIEPGERLSLIGRNGEGKSTLLKLIQGQLEPDDGQIVRSAGLTTAMLSQDVPDDISGRIYDIVAQGISELGDLLIRYHDVSHAVAEAASGGEGDLAALQRELDRLGHRLEEENAWQLQSRVESVLRQMTLDGEQDAAVLSAGMKRRVLLARALVSQPDILLLDEPTNHLDIDSIDWLEQYFESFRGTLLFVTHDRVFLRKLSSRILDLDRGRLSSYECDYDTYCQRKESDLAAEEEQNLQFDKKLAEEEVWIRQGIRARRTRNEGRVRALKQLREVRRERRERIGKARISMQEAQASGRLVLEAKGVGFGFGERTIVHDFSTMIMRGDKIGLIGPNGIGKTTFLKLLLGELKPQQGEIRYGTRLEISYFDQLHAQLDDEKSVMDNLGLGSDHVMIGGVKKHIYGYMQDFLFSPERARSLVKFLSGGERNRLLLARLFSKPSNVLVLDEPTNDLDAETLQLLEQLLIEYSGTVLMVSHDREFLNNVVTDTYAFEGTGLVKPYAGGYDDYLHVKRIQQAEAAQAAAASAKPKGQGSAAPAKAAQQKTSAAGGKRLTYGEQLELEKLPAKIEELETRKSDIHDRMSQPDFYSQDQKTIAVATAELEAVEAELAKAYARWEELEERAG